MFGFRKKIYFDNNATTPVSKKVRYRINNVLKTCYSNPSSLYYSAFEAANILLESRKTLAETINAGTDEIIFTGCATESNNMVLKSLCDHFLPEKNRILSTPVEHPSIINTLEYLKIKTGLSVEWIPVDRYGFVDIAKFEKMIDERTFLVVCMFANNETGTIQPVKEITEISHLKGVPVLSDCVQALGKIPVDMKDLGVDYASFSAHKIHGPKGSGALYIKKGAHIASFIHGGHQEGGLRAGTESLHNIAGFGEACKDIPALLEQHDRILKLKERFAGGLKKIRNDIVFNSPLENALANTLNVTFHGIDNGVFMGMLNLYGIAVSAGSACSTPENKPSQVLKAIGLTDNETRETIRFSISEATTEKEIDYVLKVVDNYFTGKIQPIGMISPGQLDKDLLFHKGLYILDVRFGYDRLSAKSLPGAHECPFFTFRRYMKKMPRDKNILVICQSGMNSPLVAYYLRAKGFRQVSFLMTGMLGWKFAQPELYKNYAGQNIKHIEEE